MSMKDREPQPESKLFGEQANEQIAELLRGDQGPSEA
jgi:hypothetical protein